MRMNWFTVILLTGLAVCGLLVVRHQRRTAVPGPMQDHGSKTVDVWQKSIRLDPARSYRGGPDPLEKLRREEERQKPQEGRN